MHAALLFQTMKNAFWNVLCAKAFEISSTVSSRNWLILGPEKTPPIAKSANCETKQTVANLNLAPDRIQMSTFSEDLQGKRCLFGTFITKDTKCNSTLGFPNQIPIVISNQLCTDWNLKVKLENQNFTLNVRQK